MATFKEKAFNSLDKALNEQVYPKLHQLMIDFEYNEMYLTDNKHYEHGPEDFFYIPYNARIQFCLKDRLKIVNFHR